MYLTLLFLGLLLLLLLLLVMTGVGLVKRVGRAERRVAELGAKVEAVEARVRDAERGGGVGGVVPDASSLRSSASASGAGDSRERMAWVLAEVRLRWPPSAYCHTPELFWLYCASGRGERLAGLLKEVRRRRAEGEDAETRRVG